MDAFAEFDDLLGPASKPVPVNESKRIRAAQTLDRMLKRKEEPAPVDDGRIGGVEADGGVTVFWLAKVWGLEVSTVRKRLADAPTLRRKSSGHLYSIPVAARYLSDPITDVASYLKTLRPGDLPENIRASFWDAKLKQQKWEVNARHLWHTTDVTNLLGSVFVTMKSTMDLWAETLERSSGLTDDQRKKLEAMVDALQGELQDALVNLKGETYSSAFENSPAPEDNYDDLI